MNTSIHIFIRADDEILPVLGDRAANVAPMLQIYNKDVIGGPLSISFEGRDDLDGGIRVADELIGAIIRIRTELAERRSAGFGRPLRPVPAQVPIPIIEDHGLTLIGIAGAGDPEGQSPDAPVADE